MGDMHVVCYSGGHPATELIPQQRFWAKTRKVIPIADMQRSIDLPCECHIA